MAEKPYKVVEAMKKGKKPELRNLQEKSVAVRKKKNRLTKLSANGQNHVGWAKVLNPDALKAKGKRGAEIKKMTNNEIENWVNEELVASSRAEAEALQIIDAARSGKKSVEDYLHD